MDSWGPFGSVYGKKGLFWDKFVCLFCFIRCLTPPGHSECITAALQPVKYLQKYSREQTIESASDEMTYKLVKFHGTKEG